MDQQEPTFEDSVAQVMKTLPPVIRTYLAEGKYTTVARILTTRYGLRIDQAGVLEREIMLLLMGIETPPEFVQALTEEARLDKKIVDSIVQDVNEQIFVPLRTEEQRIGMSSAPMRGVAEEPEKKDMVSSVGKVSNGQGGPAQPKNFFNLENKIAPPAPALTKGALPPRAFLPRSSSPVGAALSQIGIPQIGIPVMLKPEKPLESSRLLGDHEEPHIELDETPREESPKTEAVPTPSRIVPANLPGAMPEVAVPVVAPRPEFRTPLPVTPSEPTPIPSTKSYAVDPYREPIEEK